MWQFSTFCRFGRFVLRDTTRPLMTFSDVAKEQILFRQQCPFSNTTSSLLRSAGAPGLKTLRCSLRVERDFHTSSPRYFHPFLLVLLRPLTKVVGILVGRGFRKWWQALPKDKRLYFTARFKENRIKIYGAAGLGLALGGVYYESHVELTPFTNRRRFILFNPKQFESISSEMFKLQIQSNQASILPTTHKAYTMVKRVSNRLMQANRDIPQIHDKHWSITIIDNPAHNAFILPSGQIFVFTGMLQLCTNDDQLGAVLGHEMAHAVLGHSAEMLSYTHIIDLAMMIVVAAVWALMPSDLTSMLGQWISGRAKDLLLELPYSRMLETEADEVGLELTAKACFDVREAGAFWSRMDALTTFKSEGEIEWLSTHPNHDTRAAFVEDLLPKAIERRKQLNCPGLPSKDPRNEVEKFKKWLEDEQKKEMAKVALVIPIHS